MFLYFPSFIFMRHYHVTFSFTKTQTWYITLDSLDRHKQVQHGGLHFLWYGKHAWLEPEGRKKEGTVECVCECVCKRVKIREVFSYPYLFLDFIDIPWYSKFFYWYLYRNSLVLCLKKWFFFRNPPVKKIQSVNLI